MTAVIVESIGQKGELIIKQITVIRMHEDKIEEVPDD